MIVGVGTGIGFGGALPWTPTSLGSGCSWFLADRGITLGTGVSAWADQSGQGRHLAQATAGSQPAWSATSFNSKPGITFDGLSHWLGSAGIGALASGDDHPVSLLIAAQVTTVAVDDCLWNWYNSATAFNDYMAGWHSAPGLTYELFRTTSGSSKLATSATGFDTNRHALSWVFSGTQISMWSDGVATSLAGTDLDTTAITFDWFALGALVRGDGVGGILPMYHIPAVVAGLIVVDRALTTAERTLCEAWLTTQCGV